MIPNNLTHWLSAHYTLICHFKSKTKCCIFQQSFWEYNLQYW